jgi:hypothetical protein
VDSAFHQVAKRPVDHPLPLDARPAAEGGAFHLEGEVALARRIVAGMAAMLFAVVDQLDVARLRPARWQLRSLGLYRPTEQARK